MTIEVVRAPLLTSLEAHTVDALSVGATRSDTASELRCIDEHNALPVLLCDSA